MSSVKAATELNFAVPSECDGMPLQNFLHRTKGVSQRIIRSAKRRELGITADGEHMRTVDFIRAGQNIRILLPEPSCTAEPADIELDIVYEDEHYLILNKGSGIPVHPTSNIHINDTLLNGIARYMRECGDLYSVSIVNRLDRDTSGLVLTAKNAYAAELAARSVEKEYLAVCEGKLDASGVIDAPIARAGDSIIKRRVFEDGVRAVTHYRPLKSFNGLTLASISLDTGRTHQIRVHFSHIGHPLAGDDMYGGAIELISRQALHCCRISFVHPILNKRLDFEAPLPSDMSELLL